MSIYFIAQRKRDIAIRKTFGSSSRNENAATDEIFILIFAHQPNNSHTTYGFRHTHHRQDCIIR